MIEPPPTVEPQFSQIWRNWLNNLFNHIAAEDSHIVGETGEPSFQNSWVNFDSSTERPARFYKDPFGMVHLAGLVKDGTISFVSSGTIFTLPSSYLPEGISTTRITVPVASGNAFGQVTIEANGDVRATIGSNSWVSLDGITFRASQ